MIKIPKQDEVLIPLREWRDWFHSLNWRWKLGLIPVFALILAVLLTGKPPVDAIEHLLSKIAPESSSPEAPPKVPTPTTGEHLSLPVLPGCPAFEHLRIKYNLNDESQLRQVMNNLETYLPKNPRSGQETSIAKVRALWERGGSPSEVSALLPNVLCGPNIMKVILVAPKPNQGLQRSAPFSRAR